jgi:hypothetical protein
MPDKKNKGKGKTISNKAAKKSSVPETQAQSSSKRQRSASLQEVPDEEPTHRGQVLNNNTDTIIEEVGSPAADGKEPVNVTDSESEDDEKKLREQSQRHSYHASSLLDWLMSTEKLAQDWTAPVYAFFKPMPIVGTHKGRPYHIFVCAALDCKHKSRDVRRFLDKSDAKSTGNMRRHAKHCWGGDVIEAADKADTANEVRRTTIKGFLDPQSVKAAFDRKGKGKVQYTHRQHTTTESRYVASAIWQRSREKK